MPGPAKSFGRVRLSALKVEPRELDNLPVINPLALPENARQIIRGWIADFYCHQQAAVLT